MLTTDSYYSTPNLDALMAEFGLSRTPGLVVEGDSGHSLSGYPYYLLPDYAEDTGSGTLDGIDTSRRVLLQMAQGITLTETEGVTSEPLLVSSESSYSKTAGYEMTTAGQEGTTLVESKALEAAPITIPNHTAAALGLVFVLILPAAVLAVGAVVVLLRRRR